MGYLTQINFDKMINIQLTDDPGNSFNTAENLGVLNNSITFGESININPVGDLDDFYRFIIDSESEVTISVGGVSERLDVDLLSAPDFNSRIFLDAATPSQPLSRTVTLEPGDYYLKVFTFNLRSSEYEVTLSNNDNISGQILFREEFSEDFDITNDDIFELDSSFLPIRPELVEGTALEGVVGTQLRIDDESGREMGLPTVIDVVDDDEVDTALRLQLDTYNPSASTLGDSFFGTGIKTKDTFNPGNGGLAVEARVRIIDSEENPLARGVIDSVFFFTPGMSIRDEIDFELLGNFIEDAQNDNSEPSIFTNVFDDQDLFQRGDFEVIDLGDVPGLEGFDLTEFNNFRIEWLEDKVVWKINDIPIREEFETLPDEPMGVFLNTWANGFPEAIDDSLIPADNLQSNQTFFYDIGYVQVETLI
ncbi:MAG: glycoside hydrolase family 16 protein [Symploca sp. SIO2E9]|nr:glycoside hydrolase family 16 protein [Symploca sp. SIO2E9]